MRRTGPYSISSWLFCSWLLARIYGLRVSEVSGALWRELDTLLHSDAQKTKELLIYMYFQMPVSFIQR